MVAERLGIKAMVLAVLVGLLPVTGWSEDPPGYIFVTGWYKDLGMQRAYNQAVGPVLREHGYQTFVRGMPDDNLAVLEGDWTPRMALLIKFSSEKAAKEFWWSDAYHDVKAIRRDISALDIVQIDGVPGVTPRLTGDSAYLVFYGEIADRARFVSDYAPFAPKVVRDHGGQFLVRAGRGEIELLEGRMGNVSLVIVEFPDLVMLRAFWNSPQYQQLSRIRRSAGKWSVVEIAPRRGN